METGFRKPIILIILFVFFFVGILLKLFYSLPKYPLPPPRVSELSPIVTPTISALIYKNDEIGFSLSYPSIYYISQEGWQRKGDNPKGYWEFIIVDQNKNEKFYLYYEPNPKDRYGFPIDTVEKSIVGVGYTLTDFKFYPAAIFYPTTTSTQIHLIKDNSLWLIRGDSNLINNFHLIPIANSVTPLPISQLFNSILQINNQSQIPQRISYDYFYSQGKYSTKNVWQIDITSIINDKNLHNQYQNIINQNNFIDAGGSGEGGGFYVYTYTNQNLDCIEDSHQGVIKLSCDLK